MNYIASDILEQAKVIYENSKNEAYKISNTIDAISKIKYPVLRVNIEHYDLNKNAQLSYGILKSAGIYEAVITQLDILYKYYLEQITILSENQKCLMKVQISEHNIPITFISEDLFSNFSSQNMKKLLPSLDKISYINRDKNKLCFFNGERIDYSVMRLEHYTKTNIDQFQEYIILVNYQMYIEYFKNIFVSFTESRPQAQMHTIHSSKYNISVINIGVGPSNAKNITDHLSVLRSKLWIMLGHCAGLNAFQQVGDYIIAQSYIRDDSIMDKILPQNIPIPNIKPIENIISKICNRRIHYGTVISTADRNWEMNIHHMMDIINKSNAIGLEMESSTIACNAFVYKIPYITFLCISDIPTLGILKLPKMAQQFYLEKIQEHSMIIFESIKEIQNLSIHEQLRYIRNDSDPVWR